MSGSVSKSEKSFPTIMPPKGPGETAPKPPIPIRPKGRAGCRPWAVGNLTPQQALATAEIPQMWVMVVAPAVGTFAFAGLKPAKSRLTTISANPKYSTGHGRVRSWEQITTNGKPEIGTRQVKEPVAADSLALPSNRCAWHDLSGSMH